MRVRAIFLSFLFLLGTTASLFLFSVTACKSEPAPGEPAGGLKLVSDHAAAATPPAVSYVRFEDPGEHAFAMEVPSGWKVIGGMYRFGKLDPRLMVDMVSPDGKIDLRVGDYHVPPFSVPTPLGERLGFVEGKPYSPNGAAQSIIAKYRPGWVFADLYGQGRFSGLCQHLNLKSMKQETPPLLIQPPETGTAGDVLYSCDSPSGQLVAYVFAQTQLYEANGIGVWYVTVLYSFLAPPDQADTAMKILIHSFASIQANPQWEEMQAQLTGQSVATALGNFKVNMSNIQADFQRRSAAMQSQFESWDRVVRGVDLTTDPVDGSQREVWTGTGAPHWINGLGGVIDSPSQPGPNYHRLITEP
jgi:hypothetical protein